MHNLNQVEDVINNRKRINMRHLFPKTATAVALLFALGAGPLAFAQTNRAVITLTNTGGKEVLIPANITRVPATNDFDNPDSEFCFKRSKSTDNFVLFWAKEYGDDPMSNTVTNRRFNVDEILKESDRFFNYYVDVMKWVDKDTSYATKYKFLFFVIGGSGGTAFGGDIDGKVGAFWTPATRINHGPYGVVAHELGHSFQAMIRDDHASKASFAGGSIHEMTSQWMLWQVYPEWMTFENYHLNDFMKATHLAFLHEDNQYHSAQVLEYWSEKHGVEFIGKMWREVERGEDPVMTYKRLTGLTQDQFNDEIFDAYRHFVTWDMPRIEKVAARYANQHMTSITSLTNGWYQIATNKVPQNYGYNAIQLKVPAADTKISLDFKGVVGAEGFNSVHPERAGWRYGFLASKEDGSRVYSDIFSKSPGAAEFTVPDKTKFLWLVVSGAPSEHWVHVGGRGGRGGNANNTASANEQWPYQFKLTGTAPDDSTVH
jgi:hypothetical protein